MLELLPGLYKEVISFWNLDRDTSTCVAGPDMQSRITRATVYGQEVEVRVKPGEDGILFAVLGKIRCSWRKDVGACEELGVCGWEERERYTPIFSCIPKRLRR